MQQGFGPSTLAGRPPSLCLSWPRLTPFPLSPLLSPQRWSTGFSTTQAAYDATQEALFATLDALEARLAGQRFVCGERFTEADLRLFPTLVRFDACYAMLFKCCRRRVADYPALSSWMRDVHQLAVPGGGLQVKVRAGGRRGAAGGCSSVACSLQLAAQAGLKCG